MAVGVGIVLAGIAHLVGVEFAVTVLRMDKHRHVDVRVDQHLEQFVARGHRPFDSRSACRCRRMTCRSADPSGREVVMAEDAGAIGVVEDAQPPGARLPASDPSRRRSALRSMPQAGAKSRETCFCSAAVSARHSASLTTVLALMTETAIVRHRFAPVGWSDRRGCGMAQQQPSMPQ